MDAFPGSLPFRLRLAPDQQSFSRVAAPSCLQFLPWFNTFVNPVALELVEEVEHRLGTQKHSGAAITPQHSQLVLRWMVMGEALWPGELLSTRIDGAELDGSNGVKQVNKIFLNHGLSPTYTVCLLEVPHSELSISR